MLSVNDSYNVEGVVSPIMLYETPETDWMFWSLLEYVMPPTIEAGPDFWYKFVITVRSCCMGPSILSFARRLSLRPHSPATLTKQGFPATAFVKAGPEAKSLKSIKFIACGNRERMDSIKEAIPECIASLPTAERATRII